MTGTMTWVGFDVHARSAHAAAIDVMTGELSRMRFGPGFEAPVAWLGSLPGPVRACYEAGPTGFGFYRAAVKAGIGMDVIAPGKTPRGRSDRVKTDRKDAELLARLLLRVYPQSDQYGPHWKTVLAGRMIALTEGAQRAACRWPSHPRTVWRAGNRPGQRRATATEQGGLVWRLPTTATWRRSLTMRGTARSAGIWPVTVRSARGAAASWTRRRPRPRHSRSLPHPSVSRAQRRC